MGEEWDVEVILTRDDGRGERVFEDYVERSSPYGAGVANPRDVAFVDGGDLLVANNDTESVLLMPGAAGAGGAAPAGSSRGSRAVVRRDRACENPYDGADLPQHFMGPTLYNASEDVTVTAGGDWCDRRDLQGGQPCWCDRRDLQGGQPCWCDRRDLQGGQPCWCDRRDLQGGQ
eukprot:gene37100-37056_t